MAADVTKTIVFDAVGTLIYPDPEVAAVYTQIGERFGSRLKAEEVAARFRAVFHEVEARDRAGDLRTSEEFEYRRWQEIVSRVLDDVTDRASCFAELYGHFARATAWRVFADVGPAFDELGSRGVSLVVASNFDERFLGIASQLPALRLCRHVLVSSRVGWRKPHPQFFRAVLETVGTGPEGVLYVGDDLENDVDGPRSVGLPAVQLIRRGPLRDGAIRSLKELLNPRSDYADY